MRRSSPVTIVAGLLAINVLAACRSTTPAPAPSDVRPATEGQTSRPAAPAAGVDRGRHRYTEADVRFVQRMIGHHAQALAMTALVPARTSRDDMRLLAERIEVSQRHEIGLMRRWLTDRHEEVPSADEHHEHQQHLDPSADSAHAMGHHEAPMPGMLTPEELRRLAAATGTEFDRRFLELMIRHHEGALTMVAELLATNGAGQETDVFRFASEVDADQRAEIARMRTLLGTLPNEPHDR
jgi:uncharacterized protein (DUF305 family)